MRAIHHTARRFGDFSPEWLASLRFISWRETSGPPSPIDLAETVGPADLGALLSEVKRSVASHEDNKARRFAGRVKMQRVAGKAASYASFLAISPTRRPSALARWRS